MDNIITNQCRAAQEGILETASKIINGPRRDAYGSAKESFGRIAAGWSALLETKLKQPITARDVALLMVVFKAHRDANKAGVDNLVDICGYAALAENL